MGSPASAPSKELIMPPVKVADIISTNSHGILFANMTGAGVLRYGRSDGVIAAIFSMSSVVSCVNTSIASSTVTIPTRRFSLSTTGRASRS